MSLTLVTRPQPDDPREPVRRTVLTLVTEFRRLLGEVEAKLEAAAQVLTQPPEFHPEPMWEWAPPTWLPVNWTDALGHVCDLLCEIGRQELPAAVLRMGGEKALPGTQTAWRLLESRLRSVYSEEDRPTLEGMSSSTVYRSAVAASFAEAGVVREAVVAEWHAFHGPDYHDKLARTAKLIGLAADQVAVWCDMTGDVFAVVRRTMAGWAWAKRNAELWEAAELDGVGLATLPPTDEPAEPTGGQLPPSEGHRLQLSEYTSSVLARLQQAAGPLTDKELMAKIGGERSTARHAVAELKGHCLAAGPDRRGSGYRLTDRGRSARHLGEDVWATVGPHSPTL